MKNANIKTLLARNLGLWLVAALLYPVAHWIPTASGMPPRIFEVLIPVFIVGMGWCSNAMLRDALNREHPLRSAPEDPAQEAD